MIALSTWLLTPLYRLRGLLLRRHMRRQPPPPTVPAPHIVIVTAPARPDPHTATLRRHFAEGVVPHGRTHPLLYHEYARIARAVRMEHADGA